MWVRAFARPFTCNGFGSTRALCGSLDLYFMTEARLVLVLGEAGVLEGGLPDWDVEKEPVLLYLLPDVLAWHVIGPFRIGMSSPPTPQRPIIGYGCGDTGVWTV